jgi:hypothetical protein
VTSVFKRDTVFLTKDVFMSPILKVQAYSVSMSNQHLASEEATIQRDQYVVIRVPLGGAHPFNGGPIVGEQYLVRYNDEAGLNYNDRGFRYLGIFEHRLVFTTAPT